MTIKYITIMYNHRNKFTYYYIYLHTTNDGKNINISMAKSATAFFTLIIAESIDS